MPRAPASAMMFINLHPNDLADEELYDPTGGLAPFAERIVLEITERAALDQIRGSRARRAAARDRLPDRGRRSGRGLRRPLQLRGARAGRRQGRHVLGARIESSAVKRKLVGAIAALSKDLNIKLVAEGIETAAERDCIVSLGADALQGYLFAPP